ncbi:hypothetical protein [Ammoniphilus sp. 3BR4]|uniref:hypothetical protein n=1 Tax=Ammoniphilus sp. 3BR4 TaxID=3158265 RepID=UPI0034672B1E
MYAKIAKGDNDEKGLLGKGKRSCLLRRFIIERFLFLFLFFFYSKINNHVKIKIINKQTKYQQNKNGGHNHGTNFMG